MDKFKGAQEKAFIQLHDNVGLYTTIIVTLSYHLLFERDFACACKPQNQWTHCSLHLLLPVLLFWSFLLWIDKTLQRACSKWVQKRRRSSVSSSECSSGCPPDGWPRVLLGTVLVRVVHALCVSVIWSAVVLLDGDWFVCCWNDGSETQAQVACKDPPQRTPEEKSIIADLKTLSRIYGLAVLLAVAAVSSFATWLRVCYHKTDMELTDVVLEDGQGLVLSLMRQGAMDKLTKEVKAYIEKEEWSKCSGAMEQLITEMMAEPKSPGEDHVVMEEALELNDQASGSEAQTEEVQTQL